MYRPHIIWAILELCCNDDGENVSLCRSFVVSAVFAQRTFDAGVQSNGDKEDLGQSLYQSPKDLKRPW